MRHSCCQFIALLLSELICSALPSLQYLLTASGHGYVAIAGFRLSSYVSLAAYQNAVREQKLAAEISAAKRERDFYMGQVDKAKGIEAMKERKRKVRKLRPTFQNMSCHASSEGVAVPSIVIACCAGLQSCMLGTNYYLKRCIAKGHAGSKITSDSLC